MAAGLHMRTKHRRNLYGPARGQILIVLCVVLAIVMMSLGATFVWLYKPSTHAELPFDTDPTPIITDDIPVGPADSSTTATPSVPIYSPRENVYNFLVVGHDRAAVLADVIMLVNYDVDAGKVAIMQFPRDTYIDAGSNVPKINVLFAAYYNRAVNDRAKNPTQVAADRLAETLEQNLCIQIQYTAVMNLDGFVGIVDSIGGVDVEIPYAMEYEDPEQDLYIHFKAGLTHLTGEKAEEFVRFRNGYLTADIGRVDAQKIFLAAFIDKVQSSVSITNIPLITDLASEVVSNLTTNVTAADVVFFGKNALSVDLSKISMMTVPGDTVKSNGSWYYVVNRGATLQMINTHFNIYDNDITESIFDKNRVFNDMTSAEISGSYNADTFTFGETHNANDVIKDSIDIPHT